MNKSNIEIVIDLAELNAEIERINQLLSDLKMRAYEMASKLESTVKVVIKE